MYKNGKPNYNEIVFNDEQLIDILDLYNNGYSSVKIGKKYGVSHKIILKVLHKLGVNVDQKRFIRKYKLNEEYFDVIDTPNKAYILGFLYSDGCNSLQKSTVSIALQADDRDILEQMRIEIGSEKPLVFLDKSNKNDFGYHYKNQYQLIMFSKHMCESLIDKGVTPNKSLTIDFPKWLPDYLLPHFVRGVFDGDGSLYSYYHNPNNQSVVVTITATDSFCNTLKSICLKQLGINAGIYEASCHNGITKVFTISGRNVCNIFLTWLYQDATLFLSRKYNRYCEYYNINNSLSA